MNEVNFPRRPNLEAWFSRLRPRVRSLREERSRGETPGASTPPSEQSCQQRARHRTLLCDRTPKT
eukprot:4477171-Amphidinium_carterae.1